MNIPSKYKFLRLISWREQIVLLELLRNKQLRTNQIYKKEIYKSFKILCDDLKNMEYRGLIRKLIHSKSNVSYYLTNKGYGLISHIAIDEEMFKTHLKNAVLTINTGNGMSFLLKELIEYELINDGMEKN